MKLTTKQEEILADLTDAHDPQGGLRRYAWLTKGRIGAAKSLESQGIGQVFCIPPGRRPTFWNERAGKSHEIDTDHYWRQ